MPLINSRSIIIPGSILINFLRSIVDYQWERNVQDRLMSNEYQMGRRLEAASLRTVQKSCKSPGHVTRAFWCDYLLTIQMVSAYLDLSFSIQSKQIIHFSLCLRELGQSGTFSHLQKTEINYCWLNVISSNLLISRIVSIFIYLSVFSYLFIDLFKEIGWYIGTD